ncbi:hypothetical protein K2D_09100 [Planctomycetes bacterium K2D]|uniref:Uncharacterized protein n=1 Tax=Botrimarina mediterranea TaxID=2528022 RepID=A0A518K4Q4_9BACT|nr:hypothetical protein Spa11_09270 [Botrimarina mediterranea]QDV77319.1 hypothetical protein K2D_09100 [Planctomycetes bacterium K2D]
MSKPMLGVLICISVVAVPVFLYLAVGYWLRIRRGICPACGQKRLKMVNFVRATIEVDGERAPDAWSYHECEHCNKRFKQHRGRFTTASEHESRHFDISRKLATNRRNFA